MPDDLSDAVMKLRERVNAMQSAFDKGALDDEGIQAYEDLFDMYERASDALARRVVR